MVSMAIPSQICSPACTRESSAWTTAARNDVLGFFAQSLGFVGAAVFLYALGPALGTALIAVSLVIWSLLRSQIASDEEEEGATEYRGPDAALYSPKHCANPVWIRGSRFGVATALAVRSVQRQGV